MIPSITSFNLPPTLPPFTAPLPTFQAFFPHSTRLVIGGFVFSHRNLSKSTQHASTDADLPIGSTATAVGAKPELESEFGVGAEREPGIEKTEGKAEPLLLLLHRASSDVYGDLWDFPGGSVEESDASIIAAVEREVLEETGLYVCEIVNFVGWHTWSDHDDEDGWTAEEGEHGNGGGGRKKEEWAKFSFIVRVSEELEDESERGIGSGEMVIKLAEKEHQAFRWGTEGEMKASLAGEKGSLEFIAREEMEIAVEAFRLVKGGDN